MGLLAVNACVLTGECSDIHLCILKALPEHPPQSTSTICVLLCCKTHLTACVRFYLYQLCTLQLPLLTRE